MRLRRVLLVAASILLLVLLSGILLNFLFSRHLRPTAESALSGLLGAPVSIRSLSVGLFRGVLLSDLRVTQSNRPVIRLDRFSLIFKPSDLLRGRLIFQEAKLSGLELLVSDAADDLTPYFAGLVSRLGQKGTGPGLPVRIDLRSLKARDCGVTLKGRHYGLDTLSVLLAADGLSADATVKDFGGWAGLKASFTRSTNGCVSFSANYTILDRKLRRFAESGNLRGGFTNSGLIVLTNTLAGPGLFLSTVAAVRPGGQTVDLVPGLNSLSYRGGMVRYGGRLKDFKRLIISLHLDSDGLDAGLFARGIEGRVAVTSEITGSLADRTVTISRASLVSEKISVSNILSNGLSLRDVRADVRANRLVKLTCLAESGEVRAGLKCRTSDFFSRPLEIGIDAGADLIVFEQIRFVKRRGRGSSGVGRQSPFTLNLTGNITEFRFGKFILAPLTVQAGLDRNGGYTGQSAFGLYGSRVKGRFAGSGGNAEFTATVTGLDLGRFVKDVDSALDAEISGRFASGGGGLSLSAALSDEKLSYRGLEITGLKGLLALENGKLFLTNGRGIFHGGSITHSFRYDLGAGQGRMELAGTGIDVKSLYHRLVSDADSEFTGKGDLSVGLDLGPARKFGAAGRVTLSKGIIQETKLQKQIASALLVPGNQCVTYVLYDTISLGFGTDGDDFSIGAFSVRSSDIEFDLNGGISLKEKRKGNLAMDLLVSQTCVEEFPNPHQFVVSAISRRDMKWSLIKMAWKDGETSIVRPERQDR